MFNQIWEVISWDKSKTFGHDIKTRHATDFESFGIKTHFHKGNHVTNELNNLAGIYKKQSPDSDGNLRIYKEKKSTSFFISSFNDKRYIISHISIALEQIFT